MTAPVMRGDGPVAAPVATRVASPDDLPVDASSIDELDVEIRTLARQMNAETYRMLMLVRAFDDRYGFAKWGLRNCAEWLAWSCGLSLSAAREKVRTAQALRSLPAISAVFADGQLSYSKVRALTRVAANHDEDLLLAYALDATASQVEERCRQLRNADPESVHGARHVWERRSLTVFRDRARGSVRITIELPEADGELVARAVEHAVAAGDAAFGVEFASTPERSADAWTAQQADAIVAIAKAYLGGGARAFAAAEEDEPSAAEHGEPSAAEHGEPSAEGGDAAPARARARSAARSPATADHYQVVVHVDESVLRKEALRGGAGRSDLPVETVRRLTCDCSLVAVVEDEHGTPLDVGRKQRTVGTALRRALWSRDRGCVFPGCHNRRYVEAHHVVHWADGGDTSLDNTTLLCTYHHTLVHEGGATMHRDENDEGYFRRADGRVIPRAGYRAADMLDTAGNGMPLTNPSAEVRMAAIVNGYAPAEMSDEDWASAYAGRENPSAEGSATPPARHAAAEVRETAGVYRIAGNARAA
jgi:hypothetical protein